MHAIIGLGNPGPEYAKTRHNIGFRAIDRLAERWLTKLSRRAFLSLLGEAQWHGEKILLVQPQTYMNRSGEAVARIRDFYRLDLDAFTIVHDDLDLPFGRLRLKRGGGGAGGNRGIASIIETLGSRDFVRVKIGIGRPLGRQDPANFVLQPFTPREEASIVPTLDRALEAIEILLSDGVEKAMALLHAAEPATANEK